jgi:hypothetical protein
MPKRALLFFLLLSLAWTGCASMRRGTAAPGQPPLHLRQLLVVQTSSGDRALLVRLSRRAAGLRHSLSGDGSRIELEVLGAGLGEDIPEREVEQADPQVRSVRVSKKGDTLRLVVELRARPPAGYQVQEMADWILIRFPSASERG